MSRFKLFKLAALAFAVMSIVVTPAIANPTNVTANRTVQVGDLVGHGTTLGSNSPSVTLGTFFDNASGNLGSSDYEYTEAIQLSNIQPATGSFTGAGSAYIGFSVLYTDGVFANSFFDVYFDLIGDHSYTLTGTLNALGDGGSPYAFIKLDGPTSLSFEEFSSTTSINTSGLLNPGSYHLSAGAIFDNGGDLTQGYYMGGTSDYEFNLQVTEVTTAVPEPEIYAMLGVGLGLMGWVGRRKKLQAA